MRIMSRVRRVGVLLVAGLFLAVSMVGNAAASGGSPAEGIALEYDKNVDTLRDSAPAAACPVPGQRVKTSSSSAAIYLIDPEYDLNWVPNATVYEDLFDTWNGVLVYSNLFSECYIGYFTLTNGHLAKTSSSAAVYIYQAAVGGYRWIVSGTVFDRYNFDWAEIRTQSVSPISSLNWYR